MNHKDTQIQSRKPATRAGRRTGWKRELPSLAKEGWPRHQVNAPVPFEAWPGWLVQHPIIGGLNQTPRLRPLRRLRSILLMGAATCLFIFFVTTISHATTVERLSLGDLVRKAQKIVIGKVSHSRTYWNDNRKLILTTYTIEVQESLKGQTFRTLEITTIGGKIGDLTLNVVGMPSFEDGETAVVFVESAGGYSTVVGLGQGKFTVTNHEVFNSVTALAFPDGRPGEPLKMPLESFKKEIKRLADR